MGGGNGPATPVSDFLLPSFSRRDNIDKYDNWMISPKHTRRVEARHVRCTTQQSTSKEGSRDNKVLINIISYITG